MWLIGSSQSWGRPAIVSTGEGPDDEPERGHGGHQPDDRGADPTSPVPSVGASHGSVEGGIGRRIERPDRSTEEIS
jgi:hypothetical protein